MSRILAIVATGIVANVILGNAEDFPEAVDVTDADPRPAPGWGYENGEFTAPVVAELVADRRVTRLAFRNRFTQAELVTLEIASLDDPAATMAARQQAAALRVMSANLATATFIDLGREDTQAGVLQLESSGLIAAGRATEILEAPIQPEEQPQP